MVKSQQIGFMGESLVNSAEDPEYLGWLGRICISGDRALGLTSLITI